jgi:hypothetical protein
MTGTDPALSASKNRKLDVADPAGQRVNRLRAKIST